MKNKHVLWTVAALFVLSGGMRIATGIGPAIAYAEEQVRQDEGQTESEDQNSESVGDLVAALQARESRAAAREAAIEDRLLALSAAEEELMKRLAELEEAENSLRAALAVSETANDNDIMRLTAVYENMKPAEAATLFEQMAPDFASGFLVRMQPEAAAAIMAGLEPQTAYSISVIIAGRNANAPTQ